MKATEAVHASSAAYATNADLSIHNGIEYIIGTQTASTNAWTGNSISTELYAGKVIAYKLPFAGTDTAATLNLTLADGTTTTGGKAVIMNNNTGITTHYPVNTVIFLAYDPTYNSNAGAWKTFDYNTK